MTAGPIDTLLQALEHNHLFAATSMKTTPWRRLEALPGRALCGAEVTVTANIPGKSRCPACAVVLFEWLGEPIDPDWFADDLHYYDEDDG